MPAPWCHANSKPSSAGCFGAGQQKAWVSALASRGGCGGRIFALPWGLIAVTPNGGNIMKNKISHPRWFLAALAAASIIPVAPLRADIVSSDQMAAQSQAEADRAKVQSFVDRADVRERLQALGV